MFTNAVRRGAFLICQEVKKDVTRQICKSSSAPNSDAITGRKNNHAKSTPSKWSRLNKHNNKRALSTLQEKIAPQASAVTLASKEESREFMAVFPDIVRDLTDAGRHTDIPEVTKWFTKVLQQNVPNGKKNRGLAVVSAYKILEDPKNLTPENIKLANILGWCVEMFQSFLLVTDDLITSAQTRRGNICWYRNEDVGLKAINDSILIKSGLHSILRRYFSGTSCYLPIVELFYDATLKSAMGQTLDFFTKKDGTPVLDAFTMNRYTAIVKYRRSFYTFYLPVALGMFLASKYDPEMHRQARTILLEIGHFFQVQNDFLDCFGDTALTGRKGTDIRDGKCTWLAVVALQRATAEQKKLMQECYGRHDQEAVSAVRNLYEELGLPLTYSVYETESFNLIRTHIQQISKGLPHDLFFKFMEMIYRRDC